MKKRKIQLKPFKNELNFLCHNAFVDLKLQLYKIEKLLVDET